MSVTRLLFLSVLKKFPQVVLDQQGASKYARSILRLAPEPLDTEMLFNPFEEDLHLPAPFPGFVRILQHNSSELPLRQKAHDLSENTLSNVHSCSIFDTDAKMQFSNHGQYIPTLNNCA